MSNRKITHEIKLEKSVKIIIGIFAIGVFLNVFSPLLETKSTFAAHGLGNNAHPFYIICKSGCFWLFLGNGVIFITSFLTLHKNGGVVFGNRGL